MIFPQSGSLVPRHASQLYEAGLEGALLFLVLWFTSRNEGKKGITTGLFCIGYALARFFVEFFREPDAYLGYGLFGLTRGQWLSVPVFLLGTVIIVIANARRNDKTR